MAGFVLLELLLAVVIVGILATILTPNLVCVLEKSRVTKRFTDVVNARNTVERYMYQFGYPPETLQVAYNSGESKVRVPSLWYCGDFPDPNRGHGNDCDFFDEENPGKSSPPGAMPGVEFIIRTQPDLAPGCQQVDFIYSTCCGGRPQIIKTGEWSGPLPGSRGGGGK